MGFLGFNTQPKIFFNAQKKILRVLFGDREKFLGLGLYSSQTISFLTTVLCQRT